MQGALSIQADALAPGAAQPSIRMPIAALNVAFSPRLAGASEEHVRVLLATDATLPPVLVQRGTNRVIDGVHRVRAAQLRGDTTIEAVFFDGDDDDAFVAAVRTNTEHGLPLSLADRKAAAARILGGRPEWSDRSVAAIVGLSPKTVGALRRTLECGQVDVRIGRDGRARPVDAASGRARVRQILAVNPTASLRMVSASAGVSVATVRSVRDQERSNPTGTRQTTSVAAPTPRPPVVRQLTAPASRRGPVVDMAQRRQAPARRQTPSSSRAPGELLRELRDDPSLRFSESGRILLRLLGAAALDDDVRERLIDSVPEHDIELVSELGAVCAQLWQDVVERLDRRRTASV